MFLFSNSAGLGGFPPCPGRGASQGGSAVPVVFAGGDKFHDPGIDQELAHMFEIDGDAIADRRLNLTEPPFRMVGMTDKMAWN